MGAQTSDADSGTTGVTRGGLAGRPLAGGFGLDSHGYMVERRAAVGTLHQAVDREFEGQGCRRGAEGQCREEQEGGHGDGINRL